MLELMEKTIQVRRLYKGVFLLQIMRSFNHIKYMLIILFWLQRWYKDFFMIIVMFIISVFIYE